jgi:two-component system, chemotaxis family, chemotaxis protein CheY
MDPSPSPAGTIVAVSDDPRVADELRFGLPDGFEIAVAVDGRDAWKEVAAGVTPIAVVVDLQTGSAGGFSLARDMSQNALLGVVPIVMLIERDQDEWLAREAGARVILRRPLEPAVLVDALLSVLS